MELEEAIERLKRGIEDTIFSTLYSQEQEEEDIKTVLNHLTKQDKMIQKIHENFCKFDWKNSNGEQIQNQLKELYESIFKNEESE